MSLIDQLAAARGVRSRAAALCRDAGASGAQARIFLRPPSPSSRFVSPRRARPAVRRLRHADDDGAQRHAHRRALPSGVRPDVLRRREGGRGRAARRLPRARRRNDEAAARPRRAARRRGAERRRAAAAELRDHRRRSRRRGARRVRHRPARRRAARAHRLRDVVGGRSDLPERRRRVEVREHLGGRSAGRRPSAPTTWRGTTWWSAIRKRRWRCSATRTCS